MAARVRVGNFDPRPRLAVIVQALVRPRLAGVAVTHTEGAGPSSVTIEYVEGLADRLVAGVAAPACASSESLERDANPSPDRGERDILARVVRIARDLRASRGFDVDVEWAADEHGVHLVQVRPLTASLRERREDTGSHFEPYRLYLDTPPPSFHWGDIADVYGGYVAKRAPAYQLASDLGVPTGPGWVISFNGLGLREPSTVSWLTEALHAHSSECVVDFGNNLRQIVVSTEALLDTLAVTTGADPDSGTLRTAVVRAFIRGQLGVISRLVNDSLLIEYTDQGLMALNRGTAGAQTILVADSAYPSRWASPDDPAGAALSAHVASIARLTRAMHRVHGPVALEWVMDDNRPYFVDYSRLGGSDALRVSQQQTQCISRGTARGPLLRVSDDDLLHRLSIGPAVSINKSLDVAEHEGLAAIIERVASHRERPIISVSRPYAVLSVLIEHVAGFVFDEGSILGHLAILLREAGVPAAIAPGITATTAVISNGTVTTIGDGADE